LINISLKQIVQTHNSKLRFLPHEARRRVETPLCMLTGGLVGMATTSGAGNEPIRAADIRAAVGISHEVSNVAFVAGGDAVARVKSSHRIIETTTIAVAQRFRTDSTLVGVFEFLLLLLSTATFLVFRFLGIPAFLAESNFFRRNSFVGE
jgi:hypothetical protein